MVYPPELIAVCQSIQTTLTMEKNCAGYLSGRLAVFALLVYRLVVKQLT